MNWGRILYRLLIVGLFVWNWIQFHRVETLEEIVIHGFDAVIWLVSMLFIAFMTVNEKDKDEPEEVDAEEVEIHEYEDL